LAAALFHCIHLAPKARLSYEPGATPEYARTQASAESAIHPKARFGYSSPTPQSLRKVVTLTQFLGCFVGRGNRFPILSWESVTIKVPSGLVTVSVTAPYPRSGPPLY
jgi:hypothetical protein